MDTKVCERTYTLHLLKRVQKVDSEVKQNWYLSLFTFKTRQFWKELLVMAHLDTTWASQLEAPAKDAMLHTGTVGRLRHWFDFIFCQQWIKCPCLLWCPSSGIVTFTKRLNAISRHPLPESVAGLKIPSYLISLLPPWSACPFIWLSAKPAIDQLVNYQNWLHKCEDSCAFSYGRNWVGKSETSWH